MAEDRLSARGRPQPLTLVTDHPEAVAWWVGRRLGVDSWGPCQAVGIARGSELIGGVVYNRYAFPTIEASIATTDKSWASRRILRALFAYPFEQLGVARLGTTCSANDPEVIRFNERLGFRREGLLKSARADGDAIIWGMLRNECRWLER